VHALAAVGEEEGEFLLELLVQELLLVEGVQEIEDHYQKYYLELEDERDSFQETIVDSVVLVQQFEL
jgi:hypothetical protein